jgi:hypothetical protein
MGRSVELSGIRRPNALTLDIRPHEAVGRVLTPSALVMRSVRASALGAGVRGASGRRTSPWSGRVAATVMENMRLCNGALARVVSVEGTFPIALAVVALIAVATVAAYNSHAALPASIRWNAIRNLDIETARRTRRLQRA